MSRAIRVALAVVLATGVCAELAAQQPQPVFKTATQFVSVDVVVTGKADVPVTDLKKEDFEITENGKPQKVTDFAFVSIPVAHRAIDVDAPPQPPSDVATNGDSARASRAIVIFVDDSSLTSKMFCPIEEGCPDVLFSLKKALTRFLQSLSSDDEVALVWQSRSDISQDFTNDIPRLIAGVNSRKAGMGLVNLGPTWRPTVISLKSVIASLGGSHFARRAIFYVGTTVCSAGATSFEGIECLDMYEKARQADVPIYTLDPRVSPAEAPGTMAELAINTGGLHFLRQSDPLGAIDKILVDNGSFYTLGFYPEPIVNDGKYHEIKVTVKRPDVRVRSRERYLADAATTAATTSTPTHDMTKSLAAGLDDPSLPVRVTAAPLVATTGGKTRTLITMEVSYSRAGADLAFDDELRVGILSLSTDGKVKASFQRPITFKGKFKPGAQGTFVINEVIDLPDGQQVLRVGATSRALGRTGTAHFPIVVPDFRSTDLRLSPIVLGVAGQITSADAVVGLDRVRNLVPFQPTTSRAFTADNTLRIFLSGAWRSSTTALSVDLEISGGPTPLTKHVIIDASAVTSGGRQARIDTTLPLAGLPPGDYVLSVSAAAGKNKPVTRAIPFVIRAPH